VERTEEIESSLMTFVHACVLVCFVPCAVLPQILIAAMVGHADPTTALPSGTEATEGAVLTAYGLANLVYSTCAFSLVYGFICGLDSVAASSYGMTLCDAMTGECTAVAGASEYAVAPPPAHGNSLPSRTIVWSSPALRGLYVTPTRTRCSSAQLHERQPRGSTPSRFRLPSSVPTTVLRRSPSMPSNLSIAKGASADALAGSLEERSAFDAWQRKPDEGMDEHHTPKDERSQDSSFHTIRAHSHQSHPPHRTPHHSHHLSLSPPGRHAMSTASTPVSVPFRFHAIQTIDVASPFRPFSPGMAHLDLASPITPSTSPPAPCPLKWELPTSADEERVAALARPRSPADVKGELPSSLIGVWIKRCLMLEMIVVVVLIVLLYFGCAPFLRLIGEPEQAIDVATSYVIAASFGLPFVAIYHALNKGLQSSGIVMPVLTISFIAKSCSCAAVYIGLFHLRMNLIGIAWILTFTIAGQSISVYAYMEYAGIVEQWWGSRNTSRVDEDAPDGGVGGWCSQYWTDLYQYAVLAFPACAAICLEFWLFDILGALAGLLPNPSVELSVHYLLYTSTLASYMIFSGLSVSVSVMVGQKLGVAGQSGNAKQSAIVGTSACLGVSALLMIGLIFFHDEVARCLTSEARLIERFAECVPVLIAYQMVDGLNTCSTQLLRTLGVQKYGVLLHFTTYYLIGVTTAYILAFHFDRGVEGLWIGLCIGVGLNACCSTIWLWSYADWEEQGEAAIQRTAIMNEPKNAQPRTSPSYLSTSDSSTTSERTTIASMRAENAAQHGV
jgi:MATE family multidrug resistance protein